MTTLKVYKLTDYQEAGTIKLDEKITLSPLNPFIIKDVVVAYRAALRQGTHKTKGRSEVSGSRKKLYRQKGTGHSRSGSAQSPVRRHGGVAFGPVLRKYKISVNKKVRKKALASVIAEKLKNNQLIIVENLELESHKTKNLMGILQNFKLEKVLFVSSVSDRKHSTEKNFSLASRNIQYIKLIHSTGLNVYDILNHEHLVITKNALHEIQDRILR